MSNVVLNLVSNVVHISQQCAEKGLYHYAPPMLQGDQMSVSECAKTFDIAHLRIHVERFIGRMRNWHMLTQVWPMNQYDLINSTWKIIGFLVNMSPGCWTKNATE